VTTKEDIQKHRQLWQSVYENVRQDIIELTLPPGIHLREAELAERFSVSKTPVREALSQLSKDGLVEILTYRGALVTSYTHNDLVEVYQLREILQGACAREAAQAMIVDDVVELGRIVRDSGQCLVDGRIELLPVLFESFDDLIYRQTRNRRILDLFTYLDAHLRRIGNLTVGIPGRLDKSVQQHSDIYEAIAVRDPEAAESTMRFHIRSVLADQVATFDMDSLNRDRESVR
jgi:DNA-binding GntR family transcriptional regulator